MEKMSQTEIVEEINSLNEKLSCFQQQGVDIDEIQELMNMLEESISLSQVLFFQYVYQEYGGGMYHEHTSECAIYYCPWCGRDLEVVE